MARDIDLLSRRCVAGELSRKTASHVIDELRPRFRAHLPETGGGNGVQGARQLLKTSAPSVFAACIRPHVVCRLRIPGRDVNAIGHITNWNFRVWPALKQRLKEPAA